MAYVFHPTTPTRRPVRDALVAEDLGERRRRVTGLVGQAEVLEPDAADRQRRGLGGAEALVAGEEHRVAARSDDQHRLLEPRIEPAEVGEVGAVLAVGPDHQRS